MKTAREAQETEKAIARGKRVQYVRRILLDKIAIKDFAKLIKSHHNTVGAWENGRGIGLTEKGAHQIAEGLEKLGVVCDVDWLMHGEPIGEPPYETKQSSCSKDVPVRNNIDIQKQEVTKNIAPVTTSKQQKQETVDAFYGEAEKINLEQETQLFLSCYKDAIIHQAHDNSMFPLCDNGDYVGGIRHYNDDIQQCDGLICIVKTSNDKTLIRRIYRNDTGKYDLLTNTSCGNLAAPCITNQELIFAAPVIRMWKFNI